MPAQAGQALNPNGYNGREKYGHKARNKAQIALNKAIDLLGKQAFDNNGTTRLAELLAVKLESDVVGTLKALNGLFPKQVNVDVQHSTSALQLTDDQLLDIIKSRAIPAEKQIPGEIIEAETVKINQENSDNQLESEQVVTECTDDHF